MGFKQRERKRKHKAAMAAAQKEARKEARAMRRPRSSSSSWWLTLVMTTTCCAKCGGILRTGAEMVYRARPREARCVRCAEGLSYRPSVRWEKRRVRERAR